MPPTRGNGKICYIEMPATDVARSAEFYQKTFGWNVRRRGNGTTAFDDTVGEVSGAWVQGRPPATPGFVVYIMVDTWRMRAPPSSPTAGRSCNPSASTIRR